MPLSLILYLDTPKPPPPDFFGRESQAWFLDTVRTLDPSMAQALHNGSGHKPYTVSDLYSLPDEARRAAPAPYILRITALNQALEDLLAGPFVRSLPEWVRLWYLDCPVRGYSLSNEESPFAGQVSYRRIAETARALGAQGDRDPQGAPGLGEQIELQFISPTGFRSSGQDIAAPAPGHVFRGCWQKWNAFAPADLAMEARIQRFYQTTPPCAGTTSISTGRRSV
jgi:CRISPR-associated endoribonuclease Cas6